MDEIVCPGCGENLSLDDLHVGDRIDCSNCADLTLRVGKRDGNFLLVGIPKVSCPFCDRLVEVPEGFGPGDTLSCCGEEFTLTYEFSTFALEKRPTSVSWTKG